MRVYRNQISTSWLKAAAIGSVWGSTEVMLGSFLHNLRLPLAGSILTFVAIVYMTVFAFIWNDKFIILKAAIITSLIKSISPSSVLLGPMTAILLEGILFELALWIFGHNFLGFAIGGILTQMSVILHKIITLLIVYGSDLVRIADNLYSYVQHELGIALSGQQALVFLVFAYAVLGFLAAVIGYFSASSTAKFLSHEQDNKLIKYFIRPVKINIDPFRSKPGRFSPFLLLFVSLALMIFLLWLISKISVAMAMLVLSFVFAGYYLLYPQAFRIFKKFFFWVQIIILFLAGVLFYYDTPEKLMFNPQGFELSALMIFRALIIIIFFSIISIQLNNERIKAFLLSRGFQNIYLTLELSFLTLPRFIEYFSQKFDYRIIRKLILFSFSLVEFYQKNIAYRSVFLITGDKDSGKTTFTKKVIKLLSHYGIKCGGVVTEKKSNSNIIDYYATDIQTNESVLLCTSRKINQPYFKTMHFYFDRNGVDYGIEFIKNAIDKKLIFIDEVGRLEILNYGWSRIIEILLDMKKHQVWTVRNRYVKPLLRKFMINEAFVFDINDDTPDETAQFIINKIFTDDENIFFD